MVLVKAPVREPVLELDMVPVKVQVKELAITQDRVPASALVRAQDKVLATAQDRVSASAQARAQDRVLASVQATVLVKELVAMELAKNRVLHIILINSTLNHNPPLCPLPPVLSQNSRYTLIGSRTDLALNWAKLALAKATSRASEQQVLASVAQLALVAQLAQLRMFSAKMLLGMALRALTLTAMAALRVAMALRLPNRIHSPAQAQALAQAKLKATALNRA